MSGESELEFEHWLQVLRRRAPLFAAVLLSVLGVGMVAAWLRPAAYEATATVSFSQLGVGTGATSVVTAPVMSTELELAEDLVANPAERDQAVKVEVSLSGEATPVLTFTASGDDPDRVARGANEYAERYVAGARERVRRHYVESIDGLSKAVAAVERRIEQLDGPGDAARREVLFDQRAEYLAAIRQMRVAGVVNGASVPAVTRAADVPLDPTGVGPLGAFGYALVAGLFIAGGATALAEFRDHSVRTPREVRGLAGVPVIGTLGGVGTRRTRAKGRGAGPVMLRAPDSSEAESVRSLRAAVLRARAARSFVVLLTSCRDDDGAEAAAVELAISFARAGDRTLLLQLALPGGVREAQEPSIGVHALLDGAPISGRAVALDGVDHLRVLTVGIDEPDALAHSDVATTFSALREDHSCVVVRAPGVLTSSVALDVAGLVDGVVICVRLGSTGDRHLEWSAQRLALVQAGVLGVLLT